MLLTFRHAQRWLTAIFGAGRATSGQQTGKGMANHRRARSTTRDANAVRDALLLTPLEVQGHIAKADGRVSAVEAKCARGFIVSVLAGMRGNRSDLEALLGAFRRGQSQDFDLERAVKQFRDIVTERVGRRSLEDLFRGALEMAWADGSVHPAQRRLLDTVARILGLSPGGLSVIEEMAAESRTGSSPDLAGARIGGRTCSTSGGR